MKQIEKQVIRKRAALIRKGRAVFASAIRDQYQAVINAAAHYSPQQLKEMLHTLVKEDPIQMAFEKMYVQAVGIADLWRKYLMPPKKDGVDDMYHEHFVKNLKTFAKHRTAARVTGITETTRERIAQAIDYAMSEGVGVPSMVDMIIENVARDYKEITEARARLISQTEMVTASNEASQEAARSLTNEGLEMRKFWSTSGLPTVRESHLETEADSNDVGGYKDGEAFLNGLQYPGEPSGPAEEVINCHCTLLWEVV